MDLPLCPACGQSVLEDDAVNCPFCGAPMKGGGPATRPAGGKPAPAKAAAGKPAPAAPGASASAAKPASAPSKSDDDPFDVRDTATQKTIPLFPRSGGGRTMEVVCPMCETRGFLPPTAAGKLVKCHNPECLVPVFTAPAAPPKSDPDLERQKASRKQAQAAAGSRMKLMLIGGVALVAVTGGVCFWVMNNNSGVQGLPPLPVSPVVGATSTKTPGDTEPGENPAGDPAGAQSDNASSSTTSKSPADVTITPPVPAKPVEELRKLFTERALTAARQTPETRKPFARRLTASAYIYTGDLSAGKEQIERLVEVSQAADYEAVIPWIEYAWRQQTAGNTAEFQLAIGEAIKQSQNLPPRGRTALEAAISLATALVYTGKASDAQTLLDRYRSDLVGENLAASLHLARVTRRFDIDQSRYGQDDFGWQFPLESAVTVSLCQHAAADKARDWAQHLAQPVARAESLLAWCSFEAERVLSQKNGAEPLAAIHVVAKDLPPAGQARFHARLAQLAQHRKDTSAAEASLQTAVQMAHALPVPPPLQWTKYKEVLAAKLPESFPARWAALANWEVALLQAQGQNGDSAWKSGQRALAFLRTLTPSPASLQQRLDDIAKSGDNAIRQQIKQELELKTDDEARRVFGDYKTRCQQQLAVAQARQQLQARVLLSLIEAGLQDQVWAEIQSLKQRPDASERESYAETSVPVILARKFQSLDKAELGEKVRAFIPDATVEAWDRTHLSRHKLRQALATSKLTDAVTAANTLNTTAGELDSAILRAVLSLAEDKRLDGALQLAHGLKNAPLREDALRLLGAWSAQAQQAEALWKEAQTRLTLATDIVAVVAGLAEGLPVPAAP